MASAAIEIKEVKPNVPKPDAAAAVKDIDQSILQWIRAVDDLIREERTRTARATARAQTKIEELVDDTLRELEHTEPGVTPTNVRIPRSEQDLNDLAEEWMTDMARIVREENDRSIKLNEERRLMINDHLQKLVSNGLTEEASRKVGELSRRLENVIQEERAETERAVIQRDEMEMFTDMKLHKLRMALKKKMIVSAPSPVKDPTPPPPVAPPPKPEVIGAEASAEAIEDISEQATGAVAEESPKKKKKNIFREIKEKIGRQFKKLSRDESKKKENKE